jgi:hypothetical protein
MLWIVSAVVLGFGIACLLIPALPVSRWTLTALRASVGAGLGVAITSILYFVLLLANAASPAILIVFETLLIAATAAFLLRSRLFTPVEPRPHFQWNWIFAAALGFQVLLALYGIQDSAETNPFGEWDAWSIWNLRAKFLATPESWRLAISPALSASHPDYPLLLSGFIARCWRLSGDISQQMPIATAFLFFLATIGVLIAAVATARRLSLGLLAGITLVAASGFLLQAPVEYADVPLAFYFVSAIALAALADVYPEHARPLHIAAGLCASCAAWTKNEGFVFLAIFVIVWTLARRVWTVAAGALPVAALALWFRFALAPPADPFYQQGVSGALARFGEFSRYGQVVSSFASEIVNLGPLFAHPILLLAILAFTLRFAAPLRRTSILLASTTAAMLVAYAVIFIATPSDLSWHLGTAAGRLIVQLVPMLIFATVVSLRAPEEWQAQTPNRKK